MGRERRRNGGIEKRKESGGEKREEKRREEGIQDLSVVFLQLPIKM